MKAIELIQFLGKSVNDNSFLAFLETHHFDIKKLPKQERSKNQKAKVLCPTFLLHGIELRFGFTNEQLEFYEIVFFKPQSNGLEEVHEIQYPFGLYLNQKIDDYEKILGNPIGFIEPQSHDYFYKNYAITIFFEPKDTDKKSKNIEISIKQHEN